MSAVGDTVYWVEPGGHLMSGKLLATKGDGKHAKAVVKLPALQGGGKTTVRLVSISPTAKAAKAKAAKQ